jgi:hypothetical protein
LSGAGERLRELAALRDFRALPAVQQGEYLLPDARALGDGLGERERRPSAQQLKVLSVVQEQAEERQGEQRPSPSGTEENARSERNDRYESNEDYGSDKDIAHSISPRVARLSHERWGRFPTTGS